MTFKNNLKICISFSALIISALFFFTSCSSAQSAPVQTAEPAVKQTTTQESITLKLPTGYIVPEPKKISARLEGITLTLFSRGFAQGEAVYAEIEGTQIKTVSLSYSGQKIPLTKKQWGYRGLFSLSPLSKTGPSQVLIRYSTGDAEVEKPFPFTISDGRFKVFKQALDLGEFSDTSRKLSPETLAFIESCTKKKKEAFAEVIPDQLNAYLSHPRSEHRITSEFYSKREYMRFMKKGNKKVRLKDSSNTHSGIDLGGNMGAPVFALAAAKVAFAEPAYYEGNFIILNHGEGIFSYYMHLSNILVKKGDVITAGHLIGEVGSTGMSTGPHLHVSVLVRGIQTDPLSLLCLPIRD